MFRVKGMCVEIMKDVKIFVFCSSLNGGGAERVSLNLAIELKRRGYNVVLVVGRLQGEYVQQLPKDLRVVELNSRARFYVFKLAILVQKERPDVIFSRLRGPNFASALICRLPWWRYRCVVGEANLLPTQDNMIVGKNTLQVFAARLSHFLADKVIANSKDTASTISQTVRNIPNKVNVISNPVMSKNLMLELVSASMPKPLDVPERYILAVGRLVKQKGFEILIAAFSQSKSSETHSLVILGQGSLKSKLKDQAEKAKVSVVFLGFRKDVYSYMAHADCFVLSSWWEGFGNVVVEALASGAPVVSTNCIGGPKDILAYGQYGSLVQTGSANEMSTAIDLTVQSKINGTHDKIAGFKRAQVYSVESIVEKYIALID